MSSTSKRPKQATELRQLALIEAAVSLAAQRSPADITTADLAHAVGLTQGAVFKHYKSKQAIWLAVLEWVQADLMTRLHAAASGAMNTSGAQGPLMALQHVFQAHVEFVTRYPGVPRIIFQELQHGHETALKASVRQLMAHYRALVAELLQRAQQQGALAAGTSIASSAVLFLGAVQGLVMQAMVMGNTQIIAAQAPGVFTLFLRGITLKEQP